MFSEGASQDWNVNVTNEDYFETLEGFLKDIRPIEDRVLSVVLYGSMAKDTIRPGKSDILDAILFLDNSFTKDKARFLSLLEIMTSACEHIAKSGLPYKHPFHWYFSDELREMLVQDVAEMGDTNASKVVIGEDLRTRVKSSEAGQAIYGNFFGFTRRYLQSELSRFLAQKDLSDEDLSILKFIMNFYGKGLPQTICAAFGKTVPTVHAVRTLSGLLPGIDVSVFEEMLSESLFDKPEAEKNVRKVAVSLLKLIEVIHDTLSEKL